jgi:hypothetical protein
MVLPSALRRHEHLDARGAERLLSASGDQRRGGIVLVLL